MNILLSILHSYLLIIFYGLQSNVLPILIFIICNFCAQFHILLQSENIHLVSTNKRFFKRIIKFSSVKITFTWEKNTGVPFTKLYLTMRYSRWKFCYQYCIHICSLIFMACSRMIYLLLDLFSVIFEPISIFCYSPKTFI